MPKESLNILLAEDEFVNRLAATKMLEKMGHTVRQAVNGKQAVEMLAEAPADVVFMDIQMPGMDGMAATQAIREGQAGADRTTVPIVALTAYTMENDLENFLNAGMDACLAKPLERENLERIIRELFPS